MARRPARKAGRTAHGVSNSKAVTTAQPIGPHSIKPYFKFLTKAQGEAAAAAASWKVPDLCKAYGWPEKDALAPGGGVIGIVELAGSWDPKDLEDFLKHSFDVQDVSTIMPQIENVFVDGAEPDKAPNDADGEVALDIQVAAASYYVATGKPARIRVYWAKDIAPAVRRAADDGCDVFSISWGADEANWGQQAAQDMDDAAAYAALKGMVVFAAAGDNDSSDGGPTPANVDVPASCPHVIGCGGTRKLKGVGEKAGDETVWNDNPGNAYGTGTGGGYSTFFPMPPWQAGAPHGPGRMVPDVAANADPVTGYEIVLYGKVQAIGGTSAVAPLYAGLFGAFGPGLGFVTPVLWLNHLCFNDIPDGDNGQFRARIGPDPCTGIGSPIGRKLDDLFVNNAATAARFATRQLQAKLSQALAENERYRDLLARQASTRTAAAAAPCGDYGALEPNTNVIGGPDLVRGRYHSYARGGPCPRIAPGGPGGSCIEYSYDPGTGECTKWRYVPCP